MNKKNRIKYYGTKKMLPRRWTDDEVDFLIKNQDSLSMRELATELKRTLKSVEHKKRRIKERNAA